MLKTVTVAVLTALVATACAALPFTGGVSAPEPVTFTKFSCETGNTVTVKGSRVVSRKTATITKVGDTILTAAHVVDGCNRPVQSTTFPEFDLAILEASLMTSCRSPEPGERVRLDGFPVTDADDGKLRDPITSEYQYGRVNEEQDEYTFVYTTKGDLVELEGSLEATAPFIRGGYSGGPVTAVETGEFLGIISAARMDIQKVNFIPANVICEKMESIL